MAGEELDHPLWPSWVARIQGAGGERDIASLLVLIDRITLEIEFRLISPKNPKILVRLGEVCGRILGRHIRDFAWWAYVRVTQ